VNPSDYEEAQVAKSQVAKSQVAKIRVAATEADVTQVAGMKVPETKGNLRIESRGIESRFRHQRSDHHVNPESEPARNEADPIGGAQSESEHLAAQTLPPTHLQHLMHRDGVAVVANRRMT
jgi:hypothetical protein